MACRGVGAGAPPLLLTRLTTLHSSYLHDQSRGCPHQYCCRREIRDERGRADTIMDEKTEAASQPLLQHRVNVTRAERRLTFRSKIMVLVALALLATTSVYRRFISTPRARVGGEVHEGEGGEAAEEWSWDNVSPLRSFAENATILMMLVHA